MRGLLALVVLAIGCARSAPPPAATSPDPAPALATDDPDEVLRTYLGHPQPGLRGEAVRWWVWAGGDVPADDSTWVQRSEVEGLALRGDDAARARLLEIASDRVVDPWVRCLAALVHPVAEMQGALAGYHREPVPWRRIPLALGASVAGDAEAKRVLVHDLRTGMLDWNVDLMLAIGAHGDSDVAPALAEAQSQAEPELRLAIAAARMSLGDDAAAEAFGGVLGGADVEAALEAIDLLVQVPTDQATRLLDDAADHGPDIVSWYVELARTGPKVGRIKKAAESDNAEVRQLAVRYAVPGAAEPAWRPRALIDERYREQVAPVVQAGLMDVDPRVRREAVRSAALLGLDVSAVAHALTRDADPQVRIAAAGYLGLR